MFSTTSRLHPRVPIDVKVSGLDGELQCALRARDISSAGLYVDIDDNVELDGASSIHVEFTLPGETEPIWALCDVIRDDRAEQRNGHALHFARIAQRDRLRIQAYVQRYHAPVAMPKVWFQPLSQPRKILKFTAASELLC